MKRTSLLILVGVLAYIVFTGYRLPAQLAYAWLGDRLPGSVKLFALEGTIARGGARALLLDSIPARSLSWRFNPLALALGRAEYRARIDLGAGVLAGDLSIDPLRNLRISDLSGEVPLETLFASSGTALPLSGRLEAQVESIRLRDGAIAAARGRVRLLSLSHRPTNVELGSFTAGFDSDGLPVAIGLSDEGGPVRLNGQLVLEGDFSYRFEGVAASRDATPEISSLLAQFGTPDQDGQYLITLEGAI